MRFEQVTSEPQRRAALDALAGFHERRFRTDGGSTAFLTPALRAFQDDATRRALDRGWLRMYVLWLNDAPAAVMTALPQGWIHSPKLHDVQRTAYTSYHLDKAWLEK